MPGRSDRFDERHEEAADDELPYISKSRVVSWIKNPEHFRLKYLEGYGGKTTGAMQRGTDIHETFETYYEGALEQPEVARDEPGDLLPDDHLKWADYIEPYISNFMVWEGERLEAADRRLEQWLPVAIEDEHWLEEMDPPWSGLADVVLPAASIEQVDTDDGVVIVDFKTGKVPKEDYRDEGIHLELTYYELLFDNKYDVAGSLAYYPKENEVVLTPPEKEEDLVATVSTAVTDMIDATASYDGEHFNTNPGPLCKWGPDDDDESEFYGICPCSWGVPVDNQDRFEEMIKDGLPYAVIAERLGTTTNAVGYWKYKLDL